MSQHLIVQSVLVGAIAGVVAGLVGVFILPLLGVSNLALPFVVGAVAGAVAPWASEQLAMVH